MIERLVEHWKRGVDWPVVFLNLLFVVAVCVLTIVWSFIFEAVGLVLVILLQPFWLATVYYLFAPTIVNIFMKPPEYDPRDVVVTVAGKVMEGYYDAEVFSV